MKCATCKKPLGTSDRRRRYCSAFCRANKPVERRRHLHAVAEDEAPEGPPEPRRLKVDVAARDGSDLELLMAMRDRVAEQVADVTCPPRDLAALTRRLEEIRKQIVAERARLVEEVNGVAATIEDGRFDASAI